MTNKTEILFQKFIDGTCTQQEFNELMDMLQSNQHEASVRAMLQKVYTHIEQTIPSQTFVDASGSLRPEQAEEEEQPAPKPVVRSHFRRLSIAAATLLAVSLVTWMLIPREKEPKHPALSQIEKRTTQKKEQQHLVLPDGTQVWLNAASELTYPPAFNGNSREVYLTGEAFFDVKHAEKVPFIIHTGKVITRVLGTAFNIRAYPDQKAISVEVKRGKVEVSKANKVLAVLTPGQAVQVPAVGKEAALKQVKETEIAEWTEGRIHYRDQPLREIILDLERNFNVEIEVTDRKLLDEPVNISVDKAKGAEPALMQLCVLYAAKLERNNNQFIIKK